MSFTWCDITQGCNFILISPQIFSSPRWLCIMLHVITSLFGMPRGVKEFLLFPKFCRFDPGSTIKQNTNHNFHVVRFHIVRLFSFDFSSNFLKSLLAMHYVA